jgi:hypothetical protein
MDDIDQSAVLDACRVMLRPIASFLMKCGMTWREFANISKPVFIEAAGDEYGIKGRQTNISRIAILTGIDRKEVRRQQDLLATATAIPPSKTTDTTRVLSGWYQDPEFSDASGKPLPISFVGKTQSFTVLCQRYAGDISPSTLLKELKRVGAVTESGAGELIARSRYYMPIPFDPQWLMNAGSTFADIGNNINYNLATKADVPTRFLGRATDPTIDVNAIPKFREFIEEHGQQFIEMVDDWLKDHRNLEADPARQVRLGLGIFLIQDDSSKDD